MLYDLLEQTTKIHADNIALRFGSNTYTYRQLHQATVRLASAFVHSGIQPGDKVAFFLTNRPEAILCFLACFKIGATAVPLNHYFQCQQLAAVMDAVQPKIFITEKTLLPEVSQLPKTIFTWLDCYSIGHDPDSSAHMTSFEALLDRALPCHDFQPVADHAVATMTFTSGSTGAPKGVIHTQAQLYQFLVQHACLANYTADDNVLVYVPLAFGYSFSNQVLPSLYRGATISLVPAGQWEKIVDAIQTERVTLLYVGPTTFANWLPILKKRLPFQHGLRAIVSAGDAMPLALHQQARQCLNLSIHEGIGMTETWLYAFHALDEAVRVGSVGRACPGMQINIVDDDSKRLTSGKIGEIVVKGHSVMQGYATAANPVKDGWFYTGDCGYLDADGYLYFCGRKELRITRHETTFFPHEIEFVLYEHPAIREAGVISTQHNKVIACVSLHVAVSKEALAQHLKNHLPFPKQPDEIIILSVLPKGMTGKIDRKLLTSLFVAGEACVG